MLWRWWFHLALALVLATPALGSQGNSSVSEEAYNDGNANRRIRRGVVRQSRHNLRNPKISTHGFCDGSETVQIGKDTNVPIYLDQKGQSSYQQMPFTVSCNNYIYQLQAGHSVFLACPGSSKIFIPARGVSWRIPDGHNSFVARCKRNGRLTSNIFETLFEFDLGSFKCEKNVQVTTEEIGSCFNGQGRLLTTGLQLDTVNSGPSRLNVVVSCYSQIHASSLFSVHRWRYTAPTSRSTAWRSFYDDDRQLLQLEEAGYSEAAKEGYAKGHLCPDADLTHATLKASASWYHNAAPQLQRGNNGPWKSLENHIRGIKDRSLIICTGTSDGGQVLTNARFLFVADQTNKLRVPLFFWKWFVSDSSLALQNYDENDVRVMFNVNFNENNKPEIYRKLEMLGRVCDGLLCVSFRVLRHEFPELNECLPYVKKFQAKIL